MVQIGTIEINGDNLLSIDDVCKLCSPRGKALSKRTVDDWIRRGVKPRRSGEVIKLRCVYLPGERVFREEDVTAFLTAVDNARGGGGASTLSIRARRTMPAARPGGSLRACAAIDKGTYPDRKQPRRREPAVAARAG